MRNHAWLLVCLCLVSAPALAQEDAAAPAESTPPEADEGRRGGVAGVLLYLPNRLFDLTDIVRLRVRVGPGVALQARATQVAALALGGYTSVFAGLHGPRGERKIGWPVGFDSGAGAQVSVAEAGGWPYYAPLEVGAGFQVLIVGLDVGVAPGEALDFVTSILLWDLREDDL